jgi:hypothetical protein
MAAPENFQIPHDMRAFAEKSIDQAKQAFDGFISAAQQAVSAFEGHAVSARKGARTVAEKAMSFAEQNVAKSFELAQQTASVRLRLQPWAMAWQVCGGAFGRTLSSCNRGLDSVASTVLRTSELCSFRALAF